MRESDLGFGDLEAFMNAVDEEVTSDWLRESFGHMAEEPVDFNELSVAEATVLHDCIVTFMAEAQEDGDPIRLALAWRLRSWLTESDERIAEMSSDAQNRGPQSLDDLLAAMFGGQR